MPGASSRTQRRCRRITDALLMPGEVTIAVEFSDLNFKDGLAIAGKPGVARTSPLIPGIDLVGTVEESDDPRWRRATASC